MALLSRIYCHLLWEQQCSQIANSTCSVLVIFLQNATKGVALSFKKKLLCKLQGVSKGWRMFSQVPHNSLCTFASNAIMVWHQPFLQRSTVPDWKLLLVPFAISQSDSKIRSMHFMLLVMVNIAVARLGERKVREEKNITFQILGLMCCFPAF